MYIYDGFHELLVGGFKYFLFSPLLGEMIQFDDHIFQMGWFNHQLDYDSCISMILSYLFLMVPGSITLQG